MDSHDDLNWFNRIKDREKEHKGKKGKDTREEKPGHLQRADRKEVKITLEKYLEDVYRWVDEVSIRMHVEERKDYAFVGLRSVLHVLRDRLVPEEVFHLSAQLPILLRGIYFEGYQLTGKPEKFNLEAVFTRIEKDLGPGADIDPKVTFRAVLRVLYDHISRGQLDDMRQSMPKDIRHFWENSLKFYEL